MTVGNSSEFDGRNVRVTWHVLTVQFFFCDEAVAISIHTAPETRHPGIHTLPQIVDPGHILSNMHYTYDTAMIHDTFVWLNEYIYI